MVVAENNECRFKVLHVSRNVDYVSLRYRGNETIKVVTRELEMEIIKNYKFLTWKWLISGPAPE